MTMARLVVDMDDDLHRRLKAMASLRGRTLRELVVEWAEEKVKDFSEMAAQATDAAETTKRQQHAIMTAEKGAAYDAKGE